MNPFQIPTDNLYKFLALTGILILLICFIGSIYLNIKYDENVNAVNLEKEILGLQLKIINSEVAAINEEEKDIVARITKSKKSLDDIHSKMTQGKITVMEYYSLDMSQDEKLQSVTMQLRENKVKTDAKSYEILIKNLENENKSGIIKNLLDWQRRWNIISAFVAMAGLAMTIYGFCSWKTRVQSPNDIILMNDTKD